MSSGLFKMLNTVCIYIYIKQDLALNNLQMLICHKTQAIKRNVDAHFYLLVLNIKSSLQIILLLANKE